jgi:hypothetical protein
MAYLWSQWTWYVQMKYFMFDWSMNRLFVLYGGWKRDSLQMMIFVYVCSTWRMVELKTRFETWITKMTLNGVSLFHLSYLITPVSYQCSQWTPNVQTKYFHWSINRLFVLNRGWKGDSFEIMIFVNDCSSWSMVQLKTRFEKWKTINDVNGVCSIFLI